MNDFLIWALGVFVGTIIGCAINAATTHNINLPEEYTQISKNPCQPDTLIGFYIDDKLHIEFLPKNK